MFFLWPYVFCLLFVCLFVLFSLFFLDQLVVCLKKHLSNAQSRILVRLLAAHPGRAFPDLIRGQQDGLWEVIFFQFIASNESFLYISMTFYVLVVCLNALFVGCHFKHLASVFGAGCPNCSCVMVAIPPLSCHFWPPDR